jgi:hypothetical protein
MKLSTAIMLGRTVIKEIDAYSYCGCAIGMGLAALGYEYESVLHDSKKAMSDAEKEWPWLCQRYEGQMTSWCYSVPETYFDIISRGFFQVQEGIITLEQLVDWIASVEPPSASGDSGESSKSGVFSVLDPVTEQK